MQIITARALRTTLALVLAASSHHLALAQTAVSPAAAVAVPALHAARGTQSLESIAAAARTFAAQQPIHSGARRTIEVVALDSRLRLARCPEALSASAAPGMRSSLRMTVEITCPVSGGWRLYVPIAIKAYDTAVVATRALPRGHVITAADVAAVESDVSGLPPGYAREASQLLGRRVARPLAAGSIVGGGSFAIEPTVRRGQAVTLMARAGAAEVRAQGVAVSAGGLDERIRIKNLTSGRVVEGVVRSASLVEVASP